MTITSQQVDAWDAAVDAAYEAGRQEGMKQERALWELSKLGQEIEAQPKRPWVGLTKEERKECIDWAYDLDGTTFAASLAKMVEYKLKERNT